MLLFSQILIEIWTENASAFQLCPLGPRGYHIALLRVADNLRFVGAASERGKVRRDIRGDRVGDVEPLRCIALDLRQVHF